MQIKCLDVMSKFYSPKEFKKLIKDNRIVDFGIVRGDIGDYDASLRDKVGMLLRLRNNILNIYVYKSWGNAEYLMLDGPPLKHLENISKDFEHSRIHLKIVYLEKREYEESEDPEVITTLVNCLFNTNYYTKEVVNGDMRRLTDNKTPSSWVSEAIDSRNKIWTAIKEMVKYYI